MNSRLTWTPTGEALFGAVRDDTLTIAICPYIRAEALTRVLQVCEAPENLQVICRWDANSLLSGATEPDIFNVLNEVGAKLYIHPRIHLKLFVLSKNRAIHSSGNLTLKGLGLSSVSNIEVAAEVTLGARDWRNIYAVLEQSLRVDEQIYEQAIRFMADNPKTMLNIPRFQPIVTADKRFSITALPLCATPEILVNLSERLSRGVADMDDQLIHAVVHDQCLFAFGDAIPAEIALEQIGVAFKQHPFIIAFVDFLRTEGSARFGLVTDWIHRNCSDKPRPYRKDLKEIIRNLYNWLSFYFEEISWDVPGERSMVIRWTETNSVPD
jgi:hypothetical protein